MDSTPVDGVKTVNDPDPPAIRDLKIQQGRKSLEQDRQLARPPKLKKKKHGGKKKNKKLRKSKKKKRQEESSLEPADGPEGGNEIIKTKSNIKIEPIVETHKHKSRILPLGLIIIPTDSEPKIESFVTITWAQCCCLRVWSSVIFFESCFTYLFFPMHLTLGLLTLIWSVRERSEVHAIFLQYSPRSLCTLTTLIGGCSILVAIFLLIGTQLRRGPVIIMSIFALLLNLILVCLLGAFILTSDLEIREYIGELIDAYKMVGQERLTKITDHINMEFACCGIDNAQIWIKRRNLDSNDTIPKALPSSCCQHMTKIPDLEKIKCYFTKIQSDSMYWTYHKKGCAKKLRQYLYHHNKIPWLYTWVLFLILALSLFFAIFYLIRSYASLSHHIHQKIRTLVDEVLEEVEDEIFDTPTFEEHVKNYIRFNLSQCHTVDQVQQFLSSAANVRTYIRDLDPGELIVQLKKVKHINDQ